MMIVARDYQLEMAEKAKPILLKNHIVYLASEERTGKTLVSLLTCEGIEAIEKVLIITKKKAIEGWKLFLSDYPLNKMYTITNYESVHKTEGRFDCVILDESHSKISGYPKVSLTWQRCHQFTDNAYLIYISATPYSQGMHLLFNQFSLSNYSPWRFYKSYYKWYNDYAIRDARGNTETVLVRGLARRTYKGVEDSKILHEVSHLFVKHTRKQLGFEHEPVDRLHFIHLSNDTVTRYNYFRVNRVLLVGDYKVIGDSLIKVIHTLHGIEGGTLIANGRKGVFNKKGQNKAITGITLENTEKIDYILETWGDTEQLAIMYNFQQEKIKLEGYFKNALLLQGSAYAEGIDLSHIDNLVIYSQNYSAAEYTQRRARQASKSRKKPIVVHFLIVHKAISDQVYKVVSELHGNYVASLYTDIDL